MIAFIIFQNIIITTLKTFLRVYETIIYTRSRIRKALSKMQVMIINTLGALQKLIDFETFFLNVLTRSVILYFIFKLIVQIVKLV